MTQFVKAKNVINSSNDCLHNIWLKVNEKLGGTNWQISVPLPKSEHPIMVVGCSFSHGEKGSTGPTFVGFTASTEQGKILYSVLKIFTPFFRTVRTLYKIVPPKCFLYAEIYNMLKRSNVKKLRASYFFIY